MDRLNSYLSYFNQLGCPPNSIITPQDLMSLLETLVKNIKIKWFDILIRVEHPIMKTLRANFWKEYQIPVIPLFYQLSSRF